MSSINSKLCSILKAKGPMLTGQLSRIYQKQYNVSPTAARKAVSRSTDPIRKIKNIKFDNNQKFIYLQTQYNSDLYKTMLLESIQNSSKAYYSMIRSMIYSHGFSSKSYLAACSMLPIEPIKGHRKFDSVLSDLINSNLITLINSDTYMLSEEFFPENNYHKYKALQFATQATLEDFNDWSRKINLTSYNSGKILSDKAIFSKFQWCYSSPSYITGIRDANNHGVLVADALLDTEVTINDLQFFLGKIEIIKQFKNCINFIPALFVSSIEKDAFTLLKQKGILILQIGNLFSKGYETALKNLIAIISDATISINKNPDKFIESISNLKTFEGKFNNIQGQIFELSVAYHFSKSSKIFEVNKLITNRRTNKRNEIDVYVEINNEIHVIECKGYKYKLDAEYVKKWLSENVPNIREWIIDREETSKTLIFELWSTGGFDDEALEILEKQVDNTKKYIIKYLDKNDIKKRARDNGDNNLLDIIKRYF